MNRKEELQNIAGDNKALEPLIDEILFIEKRLEELKQLPFISVNPKNNALQKATPAAKQYKELLQQYTNCLKVILRTDTDEGEEESPLRKWAKSRMKQPGGD